MKLIVGLGNPGSCYDATRHNMGYRAIGALESTCQISLRSYSPFAQYGEGTIGAQRVALVKPLTYMNMSGIAVADLCKTISIAAKDVIVFHDDLDLPLGRVRLKTQGGDAGHYGVRSIIERLGTGEFIRIRMGIGRPSTKEEVTSYVLSPFTRDELPLVEAVVHDAVEILENLLRLP